MKLTKIRKIGKYLAGIVAAGALLSLAILPTLGTRADCPRFNFLPDDEEMFTGAKVITGNEDWTDPIHVNAGDVFVGRIYYHNGIPDTVAEDTRVHVQLPEVLRQDHSKLVASISADNADTVYDTVINGQVNGPTGLNLILDQDMLLNYIPGTVKWYPDARVTHAAQAPLLGGQSGAELFTPQGLAIGDINGCWNYAGWVTFAVQTRPIPCSTLTIDKSVQNVTAGTGFANAVSANQDDIVRFQINVAAAGFNPIEDAVVSDLLPDALTPILNSGVITRRGVSSPIPVDQLLSPSGIPLGVLAPGEIVTIYFDCKSPDQILTGFEVVNKAIVRSCGFCDEDIAMVDFLVPVLPPVVPPVLTIVKTVRDVSASETNFVKADIASPGDTLEYMIRFNNVGTVAVPAVKIFDTLPNNVAIVPNTTILGFGGRELTVPEDITSGIILNNFTPGGEAYVRFKVVISGGASANEDLKNTGFIQFCGITLSDCANTIIKKVVVPVPIVELPRTGADSALPIALITGLFGTGSFALAKARISK